MLDACVAEAGIDTKQERFPKGDVLADIYSLAVNTDRSIEKVLVDQYDYFSHLAGPIQTLRDVYRERKLKANAMDYDDLLVNTLRLFQEQGEVAARYREQFLHVLVDEYQDTNKIQAELIDAVAMLHRNLMVVGDDAQSIYSWRGANYRNILGFPSRYPSARTFKIEVNYRSVPSILQLANEAIKANVHQFAKVLTAVRDGGRETVADPLPRWQPAIVVRRPAHPRIARRRRGAQRDRGALPRALSRDGIADGADAPEHSLRHHQRSAVLRAGAREGREQFPQGGGQSSRRDGVQADHQVAGRCRRQDGRQTLGEISSAACRRQTVAAHKRCDSEEGGR